MNIIVINSAKGGVGKTEVSTGIAKQLTKEGKTVSIMDLDVTTPNIAEMKGVKTYSTLSGAEKNKTQLKKFILKTVKDAKTDFLIVDTPPTISSAYMAMTETLENPEFIFVTTPSENAIKDTSVGIKFFATRGVTPAGVIQNMTQGVFGDRFDSEERIGVPTIGEIPLVEDREPYFKEIVGVINEMDFKKGGVRENALQKKIFSKMTLEEAENDEHLPLRFYNLETWDYFRDRILDEEKEYDAHKGAGNAGSRYDIHTEKLKQIVEGGDSIEVMIHGHLPLEESPLPYEIQEAQVYYDHRHAKGLPMFVLNSGAILWHNEVILVDDADIKEVLDTGGIDMGGGRIVQAFFQMLSLLRIYHRDHSREAEFSVMEKYVKETKIEIDPKDLAYAIYNLEQDGNLSYEEFSPEDYIEKYRNIDPEFSAHVESMMALGTVTKEPGIQSAMSEEVEAESAPTQKI